MNKMNKRRLSCILVITLVMLSLVIVAGCGGKQSTGQTTIKIGLLGPLSGVAAPSGINMRDGFLLYLEEHANKLGGRQVELKIEDTASDAGTAVQKARKLVERDEVNLMVGPVMTPEAYAVAAYTVANKVPLVLPVPSSESLTQQDRNDYIMRTGWASSQAMYPLADYVYNTLGYRTVASFAMDQGFGYETVGSFQFEFEKLGGKVVKKIWNPLATKDFGPYLTQIPGNVDAVVISEAGGDGVNFFPAYKDFGIKVPIIGTGASTDESILTKIGDAAIGTVTGLHYSAVLDTPKNKAFIASFEKKFGRGTSYVSEAGYSAGAVLDKILSEMGEQYDNAKLIEAFKNLTITLPRGPIVIDRYNNPTETIYIRKVEKVNGKLQNTVIDTVPNVSQFWTYGAEAVLARQAFSRDFPPLQK